MDVFTLTVIVTFFLGLFQYQLSFLDTHVAGGDMISHPWVAKSLKMQWESGHFWSWNHGWFGGFPFLYFYFYPMYALTVGLEWLGAPEAVAFKSTMLICATLIPVVFYWSSRRWLSIPLATLFTTLGLGIFLNELDSRGGGNFKSFLAGQFSHQFGLTMMVGYASYLLRRDLNKVGGVLFFSLAILGHVYSALFAGLMLVCYFIVELVQTKSLKKIWPQFFGPLLALALTSFFWIPFLWYRKNTVAPINNTEVDWLEIYRVLQMDKPLFLLLYAGCFVFAGICLIQKKKINFPLSLLLLTVLSAISMKFLKNTPLLHIRIPAEVYFLSLIVFMATLKEVVGSWNLQWSFFGVAAILILQSYYPSRYLDQALPTILRRPMEEVPGWWTWNMSGIERKQNSEDVLGVWDYLRQLDDPETRVAAEYWDYNSYGSPRIFELTPYMTGKPIVEGLLMESSPSYPTYLFISFYFNRQTWWPGFPVEVPDKDAVKGVRYLSLFNVKYFIAYSDDVKKSLAALKYPVVYENQAFQIFKINPESRIASILHGDLPRISSSAPLMQTVLAFPESLENRVLIEPGKSFEPTAVKEVKVGPQTLEPLSGSWSSDGQSYHVNDTKASMERPQKIFFKISYFPNWKTDTGEPVELITPNMMMVETKSPTLSLIYRIGWAEKISFLISLLGVCVLVWKGLSPWIHRREKIG